MAKVNIPNKRKKKSNTRRSNTQSSLVSFVKMMKEPRFKLLMGIFMLAFTLFMTIAFFSYLFTWKKDQSQLDAGWIDFMFSPDVVVHNAAGKFGFLIANLFIHNWFGVASFSFIFLVTIIAFRLFGVNIAPFRKSLKFSLLGTIWLSLALGFFFGERWFFLGGAHGILITDWLVAGIGNIGTFFLLLISFIAFMLFASNITATIMKATIHKTGNLAGNIAANAVPQFKSWVDTGKDGEKKMGTTNPSSNKNTTTDTNNTTNKQKPPVNFSKAPTQETTTKGSPFKDDQDIQDPLANKNAKNPIKPETKIADPGIVTEKKQYLLDDGGKKVDSSLGFEVEDTLKKEDEKAVIAEPTPQQQMKLALQVEENEELMGNKIHEEGNEMGEYDHKLDLARYQKPPIDKLKDHWVADSEVSKEELINNKNTIVETLKNYKIEIIKIKATIGPTVTLYEIVPAPGVRISKIKSLEDDIALSLSALGIRIIAPMPGRGTIGIEVPNQKPQIVSMRSLIEAKKFQESGYELPIALGKTISNEAYVFDLTKMPHLLVAGATGQGKSVGLNAIITSLLYSKHPSEVKFVMVDPKKVELTLYEKIERHFLAKLPSQEEGIITDNQKVIHTLTSLNIEMDTRYELLKKAQVRNIKEYNERFTARRLNPNNGHRYLPYIVLVIDEFADLIMTAGKEVELPIARLAQLARAVGIHLIVATQRPSTNIITGVIKANFPSRIAFKVASMIDSRTILDSPGANQLIGRGDMLITQGSDLIRLQCAFIDTGEVEDITAYIGEQQGYPTAFLLPDHETGETMNTAPELENRDELFAEAARLVVIHQQGSTSLIQRKMAIGYNRAGRIMDQLERAGIVGPFEGSKARQVLFTDEYSLEQYISKFNN